MRAVFLDRDGVINKKQPESSYVTSWNQFIFLPKVKEAIKLLTNTDYKIIIVTNQKGIPRKLMSLDSLDKIHNNMQKEIEESGGRIDRIYFCHHLDGECLCRKPLPGMLDKAHKDLGIKLDSSWVIGDSPKDIQMGLSRSCNTVYIGPEKNSSAHYNARDLYSAVQKIILMNHIK